MRKRQVPTTPDLRPVREHVMVHPEFDGTLRILYYDHAFTGVARFHGKVYETTLSDLLKQGWMHLNRPEFNPPLRQPV